MKIKYLVILVIGFSFFSGGEAFSAPNRMSSKGEFSKDRAVSVGAIGGYTVPGYVNANSRVSWGAEVDRRFNRNWAMGIQWINTSGSKDEWDYATMNFSARLTRYTDMIPGLNYSIAFGQIFEDITRNVTTGNATKKEVSEAEVFVGARLGWEMFVSPEISAGASINYGIVLGSPRSYAMYDGLAVVKYWFDI